VTDRNGNPDICSRTQFSEEDAYVDDDPATDINPTMTTIGLTQNWCVWQSNRSGNWDLFGSYIYCVGITEGSKPQAASHKLQSSVLRRLPAGAVAFDAMGGRVLDPKSGVYFVRERSAVSGKRSANAVRKVVIQH
jgi:hypothetical protein